MIPAQSNLGNFVKCSSIEISGNLPNKSRKCAFAKFASKASEASAKKDYFVHIRPADTDQCA